LDRQVYSAVKLTLMTEESMNTNSAAARKVFMSHASEDRERFVLPFATRLRARGLGIWVDRWEMLPGE